MVRIPGYPHASNAHLVEVAGAPSRMVLIVTGSGFHPRGAHLSGRFGEELVREIIVAQDGSGFTGRLRRPPKAGAKLFLRLGTEPEIDTGLAYGTERMPVA
jgi:hypothetical protein